jgi:membrane complex biogenesis BtpA family protein
MALVEQLTRRKAVIGMIHVRALPGTPRSRAPLDAIVAQSVAEAGLYTNAGLDGLLIENMHDVPYLCGQVGPEIVAGMTAVGLAVRRESPLPLGVQILAAANREALATAQACGAAFVRVENFAYAHVADEGLMPTAEAGPLLRYRRQIGAESVAILADVKKKHSSHAITADVSLARAAQTIEFFGADGIVVTGAATGAPTAVEDLVAVRSAVNLPVCIGSGLTPDNVGALWPHADIFIVGSFFKVDGRWSNGVDSGRVGAFMEVVRRLRAAGG